VSALRSKIVQESQAVVGGMRGITHMYVADTLLDRDSRGSRGMGPEPGSKTGEAEMDTEVEPDQEQTSIASVAFGGRGRKRIAYAITITKDGFFQDGAAVLVYSILKQSQGTKYDISFVAFVHPDVRTSRPGLQRLGFHIVEVPVPVNVTAIKGTFLREHIDKNGCCGAAELIKLSSYRLTQYHRIIHLDADTLLLNVSAYTATATATASLSLQLHIYNHSPI
jgi:hypothetical protein